MLAYYLIVRILFNMLCGDASECNLFGSLNFGLF